MRDSSATRPVKGRSIKKPTNAGQSADAVQQANAGRPTDSGLVAGSDLLPRARVVRFHLVVWLAFLAFSFVRGYGIPDAGALYLGLLIASLLLGAGTAVYMYFAAASGGKQLSSRWWLVTASLLLLSVSLFSRAGALSDFSAVALEGDPVQYMHEAKNTPLLSIDFLSHKAPGFDLIVLAAGKVAGWNAGMMRGLGVILSLTWIPAALYLGRRLLGQKAAFVVVALLAAIPTWSWIAVRGLREDISLTLILLVVILFLKLQEEVTRKRTAWFLGLSVALLLVRFDVFPALAIMAAISALTVKQMRKTMALALLTFVCVFALSSISQDISRGDPAYHTSMYARWFANQEFMGQPGFPRPNEQGVLEDTFAGPRITLADYVLGMHSASELLSRSTINTALGFPVGLVVYWLGDPPRPRGDAALLGSNQASRKYMILGDYLARPQTYQADLPAQLTASITASEGAVLLGALIIFVLTVMGARIAVQTGVWAIAFVPVISLMSLSYLPLGIFPWRVVLFVFPFMLFMAALAFMKLTSRPVPGPGRVDTVTGSLW